MSSNSSSTSTTSEDRPDLAEGERAPAETGRTLLVRRLGLALGVVAAVVVYAIMPADVPHAARLTAATAVLMAAWWMTEALPIPATALVPVVVFPVLNADVGFDEVGASYGNHIIFLFMGGFMLALAMQRWNLHKRIALAIVGAIGTSPSLLVLGFMVATGFVSMWVSNTATAVMMLPIGVSVLLLVNRLRLDDAAAKGEEPGEGVDPDPDGDGTSTAVRSNFGIALMLGIAYSASIGSLATIIGTPPNALLAAHMSQDFGITIGFGRWMIVGAPIAVVFMVIAWLLLTKVLFKPEISEIPGGAELIRTERRKLGRISSGEVRVLIVFVLAALSWVFVPLIWRILGAGDPPIGDAGIAMVVALALFLLPAGAARGVRLLDWDAAVKLPWGVLLLFGGGLALSGQFGSSGLTEWIGEVTAQIGGLPVVLVVATCAAGVLFLTELTSNTATAATFLPVATAVAAGIGIDPMLLAIPVAIAATCAFMLPVATPPNAIAFGSGYVQIPQMARAGIWLNLIGIVLITITTMTLAVWVFGLVY
ncbi:SLC13 family permease [Brachybacterium fresconis]|uniref:Sodium-dependent dicarboxylate transporter SdcS n=1 Tax=Brachybacterium fresconis TaxID=173363 RepID=A0ABS4YFE6_9MICO|nr:DASS family sodium-coupled anion symporter [Brachybacterium fresconis]MBP2407481.1 sodium-dependent dicarboxylate transporter 2/3/5 [Brachybacterium fresconis]